MRKTIPALLLSICMSMTTTAPLSAAAESSFENCTGAGTSPLQEIQRIETQLAENGTCVGAEIYKQIEQYRALAQTAEGEELERLLSLIESSTNLLEKYQQVTLTAVADDSGMERKDFLEAAIASVVGFFNMLGYQLAAELLTQMHSNSRLNCVYLPVNANRTLQTSAVAEIKNNRSGAGAGAFLNEGNDIQRDNYFSLHNFRYVKTQNGTLVITDRYDYSKDDTFGAIQDVPIQLMYEAQEMGLLVPYYVVIVDKPEEGAEDFTSDYLDFKNGVVHIYDGWEDTCCDVCACRETRTLCEHEDGDDNKLCDVCGSILDHDFVSVGAPNTEKQLSGVSKFFKDLFASISEGWNSFVTALKEFFSFSWWTTD